MLLQNIAIPNAPILDTVMRQTFKAYTKIALRKQFCSKVNKSRKKINDYQVVVFAKLRRGGGTFSKSMDKV